ncbi:hypothetical protein GCM10023258_30850 [Terrabacter aeriphilus]|uniref:GerMN domain-containing protein n=1 Tax=Terrabacter aeriphilus TaxID=515662 RepID=A0ABP9JH93_9MICO
MRPRALALLAALGVLVVAGCGLPQSTPAQLVDPTDVPYRLVDPAPSGPSTSVRGTVTTTPRVYLLTTDELLTPVAAPLSRAGLGPVVAALLDRLAQGPDSQQRAAGLATALGSGFVLRLERVAGRTAVVELDPGERELNASRLPLAVGQVVLTLTSLDGIDDVQFVRQGRPAEVPLPDGALTSSPVDGDDYDSLVGPPNGSTAPTSP